MRVNSLRKILFEQFIASKGLLVPHSAKSYNNFRKEPLLPAVSHIAAKGKLRIGDRKGKIEICAGQCFF